ncbi:PREDICTED: uncharacterized protein LOC107356068 [Acropora digitifera]|uniref:uncharacterized protein LOC107356068 n=1 Tax=Acropora digitifera TaxID=70779 RepID=UPI00077AB6C2|nr:PREDICTED: uncharacterized protein LOC107356068 [Acropora digitifera]
MMAFSNYAITVFLLFATLTILVSGRPRLARQENSKRGKKLPDALNVLATKATENIEIQPEIIRKLYKVKKIDDLNAASAKIIPPTLHARVQTATKEDNSHQAKVRVRRRCPAGQWIHCKRPTKSSIPKPRHQRRHKRGVTNRDHS